MDYGMFAHYRILSQLGRGGMGVVYLAEDSRLGRRVAVKVMSEMVARDPGKRQRFLQEARAAAALNHPNIATIHSVEEEHGSLLLVMEYIEGDTLDGLLRSRAAHAGLPPEQAVPLAISVAAALACSHRSGIVHRDIKSSNVMLSRDGRLKVLDFGIAKVAGSNLETDQQSVMGTLDYMSPEQAKGEPVDHRTDLWSLGVLFYELLTGELPFHAESAATVLYNIVHVEPKMLSSDGSPTHGVPALREVLRRALAKDRLSRYQGAEEIERDLSQWLQAPDTAWTHIAAHNALPTQETLPPARAHVLAAPRNTAERRQITFLHCELLQRRAETGEQDPEEYAAALTRLSAISRGAGQRYGGHVPEDVSSSGLIYFGFPIAHEDDASRAIRAALEIREQSRPHFDEEESSFRVHLGISTSLAVVESMRSQTGTPSETVIGEGAKIARALAQLPHGNLLLIEAGTQRMALRGFEYRSLGAQPVPPLRDPVTVFEVVRNSDNVMQQFGDERTLNLTPLAGRKQEIALLLDHWAQALDAQGQLVLLAATAGMGKSRIVHELKQRI